MTRRRPWFAGGRAATLAAVVAMQAMAAVFFLGDVLADLATDGPDLHTVLEAAVTLALAAGVIFGALVLRHSLDLSRRSEAALAVARGALGELIESRFREWRLTPAEREVALLALKGFDIAGIAELRGAATGTVRAQLTRVYAKSGVSSRAELLSLFMDDLLDDRQVGDASAPTGPHATL